MKRLSALKTGVEPPPTDVSMISTMVGAVDVEEDREMMNRIRQDIGHLTL